jgi:hypothetical protein
MKRSILLLTALLLGCFASFQPAYAGGGPFNKLEFVSASATACGAWQADGLGGLVSPQNPVTYTITDGSGLVLASGVLVSLLSNDVLSGTFAVQPTQNPIHFTAYSTYLTDHFNTGDLYADDPCVPPSTGTPKAIYAHFSVDSVTGQCRGWNVHNRSVLILPQGSFNAIVTDGNGVQVVNWISSNSDVYVSFGGPFSTPPTKNPLHMTMRANGTVIADLYTDSDCLPPSTVVITRTSQYIMTGCVGNRPARLDQGMTAMVIPSLPNALRNRPGLTKDRSLVIGWIAAGDKVTVLDGPICQSGYAWWLVNYNGALGWTPEGEADTYWLQSVS